MEIKSVIFDMDGLLFDTEAVYYRASQRIADEMGIPYDLELYKKYLGVSDEELWAEYHRIFADFGKEKVQEYIDRSYQMAIDDFKAGKVELKPGASELLDHLEDQGINRIVASSNQRPVIQLLLKNANLTDRFSGIVSADDVAHAKPAPDIFLAALAALGTSREETLVLEDSKNGILAAEAAAIPVVMIPDMIMPTPELEEKTTAVLDSLHDVIKYLN